MQNKDGGTVARIASNEISDVVKYFQKDEYKRGMENDRLLESLGIPTLRIVVFTDSALLSEEMSDAVLALRIAAWYRKLHSRGYRDACHHVESMYEEEMMWAVSL